MSDTTTQRVEDDEFGEDDFVIVADDEVDEDDEAIVVLDDEFADGTVAVPEGEYITVVQYNPGTNAVEEHQVDLTLPPLNPDEAREITEKIKHSANQMYLLVKRAHAGRAWEALGYSGFGEYVKKEFGTSTSWAYRLLNQANVIEAIEAKVPEGTRIELGEPVARALKRVLPEVLADAEERTAGLDQRTAGAVLDDVVNEHLARIEQEDHAVAEAEYEGGYEDPNERQYDGPFTGEYPYTPDADDDEGEPAPTEPQRNPAELMALRKNLEGLFNLYSGLKSLADIADPDSLIPHIRPDRRNEFTALLEIVVPWLPGFQVKWLDYLKQVQEEERLALEEDDDLDELDDLETPDDLDDN